MKLAFYFATVLLQCAVILARDSNKVVATHDYRLRGRDLAQTAEDDGELFDPCLVHLEITSYSDKRASLKEMLCKLQNNDSGVLGPRSLKIDGLTLDWAVSKGVKSGWSTLFLQGARIRGNQLDLPPGKTIDDATIGNIEEKGKSRSRARRLLVSGNFEVLVVRVRSGNGVETTASATELRDRFFDTSGSATTFASQYAAVSFDQVSFTGTTDALSFPNIDDGVYTVDISIDIDTGVTSRDDVVIAIDTKLTGDFGAGWENNVDHYFYVLPPGTQSSGSTNWIGTGETPGQYSYYNDEKSEHVTTVMHEVGHNFDLDHSGDVSGEVFDGSSIEYDDLSCIMGGSLTISGIRQESKVFNGPKSYQLGWYADKAVETSTSWNGLLYGVVDYDDAAATSVIVRIVDPEGVSADDYYVAFNRAIGFNSQTSEGANEVMVTKRSTGLDRAQSWLEAELNMSNPTFFVSGFGGTEGLTIRLNAIDTDASPGYADLSIILGSSEAPSFHPSETPSLSLVPSISPSGLQTVSQAPSLSIEPSLNPSSNPSTSQKPSILPSVAPSTSLAPSLSMEPSKNPTGIPTTSVEPSTTPTDLPSSSAMPSASNGPSASPVSMPTISIEPSIVPTGAPSLSLSPSFSIEPSNRPTGMPTISLSPSMVPTGQPSLSIRPSISFEPSLSETYAPSNSAQPSGAPSNLPSISTMPSMSTNPSFVASNAPSDINQCPSLMTRSACRKTDDCVWSKKKCQLREILTSSNSQDAKSGISDTKSGISDTKSGISDTKSGSSVAEDTDESQCGAIKSGKKCRASGVCKWNKKKSQCVTDTSSKSSNQHDCGTIDDSGTCQNSEGCQWNGSECDNKSTDTVGCDAYGKRKKCNKNPSCEWNTSAETCDPVVESSRRLVRQ